MRLSGICLVVSVLLAACQPAAQTAAEPDAGPDYSNAPEWVKRNPLDEKPQTPSPPAVVERPPIVIAKSEELSPPPAGAVTAEGWGHVRIGMTLDDVNAAMGSHLRAADDPFYEEDGCAYVRFAGPPNQPALMIIDDRVRRIDVDNRSTLTYGGLHVGDTKARVREVFGAALNVQPHVYRGSPSEYLTVWTLGGPSPDRRLSPEEYATRQKARGIRFETDDSETITRFYAGDGAIEAPEGCQ